MGTERNSDFQVAQNCMEETEEITGCGPGRGRCAQRKGLTSGQARGNVPEKRIFE